MAGRRAIRFLLACLGAAGIRVVAADAGTPDPHRWFYERFGEGTAMERFNLESAGISSTEFDWILDRASAGEGGQLATAVVSLYAHIRSPAPRRSLAKYRGRLLDPEFVGRFSNRDELFGDNPLLPRSWFTRVRVERVVKLAGGLSVPLFRAVSRDLKEDRDFVQWAQARCPDQPGLVNALPVRLKNDPVITATLKTYSLKRIRSKQDVHGLLSVLPAALLDDREVVAAAIRECPDCLLIVSGRLQVDEDLIMHAVEADPTLLIRLTARAQERDRTYRRFGGYPRRRIRGVLNDAPRDVMVSRETGEWEPEGRILAIARVPRIGRYMVVGASGACAIWDGGLKSSGAAVRSLEPLRSAAFSPDAEHLAVCGTTGIVRITVPLSGGSSDWISITSSGTGVIAWDADGSRIAIGVYPGECLIWSVTANAGFSLNVGSVPGADALAWLPGRDTVLAAQKDGSVALRNFEEGGATLFTPSYRGAEWWWRAGFQNLLLPSWDRESVIGIERMAGAELDGYSFSRISLFRVSGGTAYWSSGWYSTSHVTASACSRAAGFVIVGGFKEEDSGGGADDQPSATPGLWLWRVGRGVNLAAKMDLDGGFPTVIEPGLEAGQWLIGTSWGEVYDVKVSWPVNMTPEVERVLDKRELARWE